MEKEYQTKDDQYTTEPEKLTPDELWETTNKALRDMGIYIPLSWFKNPPATS